MNTIMKKSIKNRTTSLILSAALSVLPALTMTSCHGSQGLEPYSIPESFDADSHYEITFWAKNDTNITQTRIYEKAIADFQNLYPGITVNLRLYTDYGKIYNDVITNISTGTTPDVCITYPDHIATYITGENIVVPLDELMNDPHIGLGGDQLRFDSPTVDEIIPKFLEECKLGENYYALPFMRSSEACYINKTYVEKLGYTVPDELTWDFIWEVSEKAAQKDEDGTYYLNGQKVMIPFIYKSTDNMMIQSLYQLDAGYSSPEGDVNIFNDSTREILYTVAEHAKTGAFSTFKISSYPANFLNAGQCVFAIDSTAGATWMGSHAPLSDIAEDKFVEFETAVRTVPQYDTSNPKMISQGPSLCVFNKPDKGQTTAAWLFAQYLLTNEVQTAYAETEGYVPTTTKAQESAEYQDYLSREGEDYGEHYDVKIKASRLILDNIDSTFTTPVWSGSTSLRDAAGQMIENVVKSTNRGETIDEEYIENLFADVTSLYRLDSRESGGAVGKKEDLGPLPVMSKCLIGTIILAWAGIGGYSLAEYSKKKKKRRQGVKNGKKSAPWGQ